MSTMRPLLAGAVDTNHGLATTVLLHLAPGAIAMLSYVGLVPLFASARLPSVAALAAVGVLVVPAVQLGVLHLHRRVRPSEPAIALRNRLPPSRLIGWAVLEIVLAGATFLVTAPLARLIRVRLFGWWPDAWTVRLGSEGGYGHAALLVTAGLLLLGTVLVAPVVEELYFRGFLLPRMPARLGTWRVPVHVALFAGYHLWSPWLAPTRFLALLPLAYIALRTQDVRIGILAHIALNATDLVALSLLILGR